MSIQCTSPFFLEEEKITGEEVVRARVREIIGSRGLRRSKEQEDLAS